MVEHLQTFYFCKSSLYRQKATTRPPIPKTRDDMYIQGDWCVTCTGERFLMVDNVENLQHLASASAIFCDGTFYTCPTIFHQLYIMHAMVNDVMYPLVFGLLPGKSEDIYVQRLVRLKDRLHQNQISVIEYADAASHLLPLE
ncbi:hypothetical protein KUTeg_014750 [Tegillarca granosa]|uniref:MULE transposase domain-containing protein n=1 Tax=Tegillarca granosa TaxID=220873 RepID=A0ABQ9ERD4_TEGGR|nr:hypothetical protein KUTeg_014750 [Tegillarca granosa]